VRNTSGRQRLNAYTLLIMKQVGNKPGRPTDREGTESGLSLRRPVGFSGVPKAV
jgi:hypothetical protein